MSDTRIKLGDKVRCRLTARTGTVNQRNEILYGGVQVHVIGLDSMGYYWNDWLYEGAVEVTDGTELASVTNMQPIEGRKP